MKNRWLKRILISVSVLFSLYILSGFFLIPYILKTQIIKNVSSLTERTVKLETVKVNPLELSVFLGNFSIQGKKHEQFVQWDSLYINFQLSSIFKMAWVFDEINIIKPQLFVSRESEDTFNFSDLMTEQTTVKPVKQTHIENKTANIKEDSAHLFPIEISKLVISHGDFQFLDRSRNKPKKLGFVDLSFELDQFSTILDPDESNRYRFNAKGPNGGELDWKGTFRLSPIESRGNIEIKNIALPPFVHFYEEELNFSIPKGNFSFKTEYVFSETPTWGVDLSKGIYRIDNIELNKKGVEQSMIKLSHLSLSDVSVKSREQRAVVASVNIAGPVLDISYSTDGLDFVSVFDFSKLSSDSTVADGEKPSTKVDDEGWYWELVNLSLDNASLSLQDLTVKKPQEWVLDVSHLSASDIAGDGHKDFTLNIDGTINKSTILNISGIGRVKPMLLSLNIDEKGFPLKALQPYLSPFAYVQLKSGILSNQVSFNLKMDKKQLVKEMMVSGNTVISDLNIHDTVINKPLLKWNTLSVNHIQFDLLKKTLNIKEVVLDKPYFKVEISEDKQVNISGLIIGGDNTTAKEPEKDSEFEMSIDTVMYKNGAFSFSDLSMKPDFVTEIVQLNGNVLGASNIKGRKSEINLKGKVDRHAPVTIHGEGNLLITPPFLDVNMAFQNMELSSVTPYSGTYAGYKINRGQLSVDLDYRLDNNTLYGKNKIIVKRLQFGDEVESDKAVSLPLKLAVALLSDENGVIDLDLVVEGDVKDPKFSVAGIVWKVIRNIVVKVVTSPFKFLAGLGGGDDNLEFVEFKPGSSLLYQEMYDRLGKLADALNTRPQLVLNLQGKVSIKDDTAAIKTDTINQSIFDITGIDTLEVGGVDNASLNVGWIGAVEEAYFSKSGEEAQNVFDRLYGEAAVIAAMDNSTVDNNTIQLSTANYMYNYIREKQVVLDEKLVNLANDRAQNVKAAMVEDYKIEAGRLFLNTAKLGADDNESVVRFTLDAGK